MNSDHERGIVRIERRTLSSLQAPPNSRVVRGLARLDWTKGDQPRLGDIVRTLNVRGRFSSQKWPVWDISLHPAMPLLAILPSHMPTLLVNIDGLPLVSYWDILNALAISDPRLLPDSIDGPINIWAMPIADDRWFSFTSCHRDNDYAEHCHLLVVRSDKVAIDKSVSSEQLFGAISWCRAGERVVVITVDAVCCINPDGSIDYFQSAVECDICAYASGKLYLAKKGLSYIAIYDESIFRSNDGSEWYNQFDLIFADGYIIDIASDSRNLLLIECNEPTEARLSTPIRHRSRIQERVIEGVETTYRIAMYDVDGRVSALEPNMNGHSFAMNCIDASLSMIAVGTDVDEHSVVLLRNAPPEDWRQVQPLPWRKFQPISIDTVVARWSDIRGAARAQSKRIDAMLAAAQPTEISGRQLLLEVPYPFHASKLNEPSIREIVDNAVTSVFGSRLFTTTVISTDVDFEDVPF